MVDGGRRAPIDDATEAKADAVDGAIGEGSMFHETHGFYVQGIGQRTATLPDGWRDRLIRVANDNTAGRSGLCLEPHDLCVAKLVAGRQKDYEFCGALLRAALVDADTIRERLAVTDLVDADRTRIDAWLRRDRRS